MSRFRGRTVVLVGRLVLLALAGWGAGGADALAQTGIAGRLTRDDNGQPVPVNTAVYLLNPQGQFLGSVRTNGTGDYSFDFASLLIGPGTYVVQAVPRFSLDALNQYNPGNLIDEYYSNVQCPGPACAASNATPIQVTSGNTTVVSFGLAAGGSITGTTRDSTAPNDPIAGITVAAYLNVSGTFYYAGAAASDASGVYQIRGLPTGSYVLLASSESSYIDEVYDVNGNRYCPGAGCQLAQGSPVAVTAGSPTPNVNFLLEVGGTITGYVTDESLSGLEFVDVIAYLGGQADGAFWAGQAATDLYGQYALSGLPPGDYRVKTRNFLTDPGYLDELYDGPTGNGIPCPAENCDVTSGAPVTIVAAQTVSDIDFALAQGVNISGYVQEDCGDFPCTPITDASVEVYDQFGSYLYAVSPDPGPDGQYLFPALPAGSYRLRVITYSGNYVDEAWNDTDCVGDLCDMSADGNLLTLVVGQPATADFFLRTGGRVTGTVTSAVGGVGPVGGASVQVFKLVDGFARFVKSVITASDGTYVIEGLSGGSGAVGYKVLASGGAVGHASEVYAGKDCANFACNVDAGTTVDVAEAGTTSGIGFTLDRLGIIRGTLTDAKTSQPIQGAAVSAFTSAGTLVGTVASNPVGGYQFGSLAPGSYRVRATATNYRGEMYDNVKCTGANTFSDCSVPSGALIAASLNTITEPIDATLDPLYPLVVTLAGAGSGRVAGLVVAIDCRNDGGGPSDCNETFVDGTVVTLVPQAAAGSAFSGWSGGGCSGLGNCVVTMNAATLVTASFSSTGGAPTVTAIAPATGPISGGTEVSISYTIPSVASSVTFGGQAAQLVSGVTGRVTVLAPPCGAPCVAGPKDVVVTTAAGTVTAPGGYTYTTDAQVSDEAAGANGETLQPALSYDGRYLAFLSFASNLVADDTNGVGDIFVRDRVDGSIVRVSVASNGTQADGASERPRISDDGRFVAFVSSASTLVDGDANGVADVFVHDRDADGNGVFDEPDGRATFRVSVASDGREADAASAQPDLSADGRWVAFVSAASNLVTLDANQVDDVFLHHWPSGQTIRVSVGTGGTEADGPSRAPSVSDGGRRVVFASDASNLVDSDGNGVRDVFLHEREDRSTVRVSTQAGTVDDANGPSDNPSIDNGGVTVAFETTASNIVAEVAVPPGKSQIVILVFRPQGTVRVPRAAGGAPVVGLPVVSIADAIRQLISQNGQGQGANGPSTNPEVSGNGNAVAFESEGSDIALGDSNGAKDVFVANVTETGGTTPPVRVSVDVDGNQAAASSRAPALSGDGRLTSFESDAPLTPQSSGTNTSVFVRGERLLVSRFSTDSTAVNTALTIDIEGTGFQNGVQVRFGGQASPQVQRLSATLIKAAVPQVSVPVVVDVTVTNANGESVVLPRAFTYTAAPFSGPDTDFDTLPDAWEVQFGLDPSSASGANGADGDPDADGVTNADEFEGGTHPRGTFVRYLAEGASTEFFTTRIALANPSATAPAVVLLRFQKSTGSEVPLSLVLPPSQSKKIVVNDVPGMLPAEFATVIESDAAVVVDRQMWWNPETAYGSHAEGAVRAPGLVWYLAEGATHSGFDLFYLLQNPSPTTAAQVRVRYLLPSGSPIEKTYSVPARSRFNIWVDFEEFPAAGSGNLALANTDVSAVVEVQNGVPIIVERAMYLSRGAQFFAAGHESAGVAAPALAWFLAEGATGPIFDEFILLANPNAEAATATITYLLEGGTTYSRSINLPPNSRQTVWVDFEQPDGTTGFPLAAVAVSVRVEVQNGVPIIVERAMWWSGAPGNWYEAHNSPGSTVTGTLWALAEGEARGTARTYVLVANTSPQAGEVDVTLLFDGIAPVTRRFAVAATSRLTVDVYAAFPEAIGREFGALVESVGAAPAQIVVERAMYNDAGGVFWAAGSNQLAARLR